MTTDEMMNISQGLAMFRDWALEAARRLEKPRGKGRSLRHRKADELRNAAAMAETWRVQGEPQVYA